VNSQFSPQKGQFDKAIAPANEAQPQLDALTLQAAQAIHQRYCAVYKPGKPKPLGVAIDPTTRRGQLVFTDSPVLLPQERFIPIQMLQVAQRRSQQ
jgi:hypothetical protein